MSRIRVFICPGFVASERDGQMHYVSAERLVDLYGVKRWQLHDPERFQDHKERRPYPGDLYLGPQYRSEGYRAIAEALHIINDKEGRTP